MAMSMPLSVIIMSFYTLRCEKDDKVYHHPSIIIINEDTYI